ncbi:MAG: hypothetical protein HS108_15510 [Planctomycetes bacterium]|jgi:tetratricopeptide (TPR) repeat protein|nr:hypothetical protein [Planctomycetota bacterium]
MLRVHAFGLALGALLAASLSAQASTKWEDLDAAQKTAARTSQPIFMAVIMAGMGGPDVNFDKLRERTAKDEDAAIFVKATVNIGRLDMADGMAGGSGWTQNPELVEKYGPLGTCAVFAPGAKKPLWRQESGITRDDVFKNAREAWDAWRKELEALEREAKENKDAKKDPDYHARRAEAWAKGKDGAKATGSMDEAIKLLKKADKADSRIETWTLRAANIALDCGDAAGALARFTEFLKDFKEAGAENRARAEYGRACAMLDTGDPKGALKALEGIKDPPKDIQDGMAATREKATKKAEGKK